MKQFAIFYVGKMAVMTLRLRLFKHDDETLRLNGWPEFIETPTTVLKQLANSKLKIRIGTYNVNDIYLEATAAKILSLEYNKAGYLRLTINPGKRFWWKPFTELELTK